MLTSKRGEEEQRINSLLQRLSGIVFVPEQYDEIKFWEIVAETGLTQKDICELPDELFFQKIMAMQWPWESLESFADILLELEHQCPNHYLRQRCKNIYQFIMKESGTYSLQLVAKINKL